MAWRSYKVGRRRIWKRKPEGRRQYIIFVDNPPWPWVKTLGKVRYGAIYWSPSESWSRVVDNVPASARHYEVVTAPSKVAAIRMARSKWK